MSTVNDNKRDSREGAPLCSRRPADPQWPSTRRVDCVVARVILVGCVSSTLRVGCLCVIHSLCHSLSVWLCQCVIHSVLAVSFRTVAQPNREWMQRLHVSSSCICPLRRCQCEQQKDKNNRGQYLKATASTRVLRRNAASTPDI